MLFKTRIEAAVAEFRNNPMTSVADVKDALTRATPPVSVSTEVLTAIEALLALTPTDVDEVQTRAAFSAAGVPPAALTDAMVTDVIAAVTGTPAVPLVPTPGPIPVVPGTIMQRLKSPSVIIHTVIGAVIGWWIGNTVGSALSASWLSVITTFALGAWFLRYAIGGPTTWKRVWMVARWIAIAAIVSALTGGLKGVWQARQAADVNKAVGTEPTAPTGNGKGEPKKEAAPVVMDELRDKHARDAQSAVEKLKRLAGVDAPGSKPAVDLFAARCAKVLADDKAGKGVLASDQKLYEEFAALRGKIRGTEEEALQQLAKAKKLQATIAENPPVYGDEVPAQLSVVLAYAKAQTELLEADNEALTRLEARIKAAVVPTVPPPVKVDGDEAANRRKLEAEEKARKAESERFQRVVEARAKVYDTLDSKEFRAMIALMAQGKGSTVVKANDERRLLAWNVDYVASLRGPDDVKTKIAYTLQYLPTSAQALDKGKTGVYPDASEWAFGPAPKDTQGWKYLRTPYNTNATWTAYAYPSGKGDGLYEVLEGQFRDKFAPKLKSLGVDLPEDERVRTLADAVWMVAQCREDFWLGRDDIVNLQKDPTLKGAPLWTEADIARASAPATPRRFMTRDEWCKRPETKR